MTTPWLLVVAALLVVLPSPSSSTPLWLRRQISRGPQVVEGPSSRALADYQLPNNVVPLSYRIWLVPYLTDEVPGRRFTFDGQVRIRLRVLTATSLIRLHARDMALSRVRITTTATGQALPSPPTISLNSNDTHFLNLRFLTSTVPPGEYTLEIAYAGIINDELEGFYRSSYNDSTGNLRWLGVTQFESTHARRAFPCFDEPRFRAFFQLNIAHPPNFKVLANMPVYTDTVPPLDPPATFPAAPAGWTYEFFQNTTVTMPTYLVAFSINQFDNITNEMDDRFKVWARPEAVQQGRIANNLAPKVISYMEHHTNQVYVLPKMDQIAIPDFSAGAMENWGLVTYRETALLFEEGVSTSANRQRVESVVTHELAHQWFGNLVTLTWWDEIWLNEGFATYYEYHALATLEPTWQLERQFILDEMHVVLQSDSLDTTHALKVPDVDTPFDANAVFDNIAYNKGGSIIRMMVAIMGEENFRLGIRDYQATKSCNMEHGVEMMDPPLLRMQGNAVMGDLWRALQGRTPMTNLPERTPFALMMDSWSNKPGYPVVNVTRNYTDSYATVTQMHFSLSGPPGNQRWYVPLTYTTEQEPNFEKRMTQRWLMPGDSEPMAPSITFATNQLTKEQWIIANIQQVGYYRVNYDLENWKALTNALQTPERMAKIHVINRAQLLDDSHALSKARLLDYNTTLELTAYLENEIEYMPWTAGLRASAFLFDRLNNETFSRELFEWFKLDLMEHMYDVVNGFNVTEDDSHMLRLKRGLILSWACVLRHDDCNMDAAKLFGAWYVSTNPDADNPIEPDLKSVVYCAGMREGGQKEYDFLFARYAASSNVASEQALILAALGCSSDPKLLESYLNTSIMENSPIRRQDARAVITAVYNNPIGVDIALDFLLNNWDTTWQLYESIGSTGRVIAGLATKLNTVEQRDKLQDFQNRNSATLGSASKSISDAIVTLNATLEWHHTNRQNVVAFLCARRGDETCQSGSTTTTTTTVRPTTTTTLRPTTTTTSPTTPSSTTPEGDAAASLVVSPLLIAALLVALVLHRS